MENLFLAPAISGFFNVMFDRMIGRDLQNFLRPQPRTMTLLEKLRRKMLIIDKLLSYAEERQTTDKYVKFWLDEVKDALYAAEDLVDKIDTQALHQKTQAECIGTQIVATVGSIFLNNVDNEIEEIYQRFENLEDEISSLGLKEIPARGRRPSTSSVDESIIFGRDSDKEKIIKFILQMPNDGESWNDGESSTDAKRRKKIGVTSSTSASPEEKIRIITITGLSGVGKTTLAQLIYKDNRIHRICNSKSWVCVSEAHGDIRQIIKTIICSIPSCSSEPESDGVLHGSEDLNSLQGRLLSRVLGQPYKFLIVLDDVMEIDSSLLDDLIFPLKSVATGGTILITTSDTLVAKKFCSDYTLHLEKLSNSDCWGLLRTLAFRSYPGRKSHTWMMDITRELAGKCDGLPLAARMIGLLLNSKKDWIEWEGVLDSDTWLQKEILPALLLSYNHLPPYLKRCFAYCSMFPKSCIFERETIVQLWLAEGFICAENRSLPQVSDNYFDELVSRSFFQQSNSNKSQFVMHSLIHELARYVSGEFSCFLAEDDTRPKSTRTRENRVLPHRTRHLSYLQSEYDTVVRFSGVLSEVNYLRTFLPRRSFDSSSCFLGKNVLPYLTKNFMGSIRVLSLSRYKITGRHLANIDKLEHLRYLDLSYTSICSLPESVCTFYHLQTLLLSDCRNLTWLPDSIGNLKQLLYLSLSRTKISELPCALFTLCNLHAMSLAQCPISMLPAELGNLTSLCALSLAQCPISMLPAELGNLTSLCHLDISGTELQHIPVQIGKLSRLQTLTNLFVRKNGGANVEVLRELRHLTGSLHISNLDDVGSTADEGSEGILQDVALDRLVLEWNSQTDQPLGTTSNVFNLLLPSDLPLESMVMKYYNSNIEDWFPAGRFGRLVSLCLEECTVLCPSLYFLQPCLKHLCLINLKIIYPTECRSFRLGYIRDLDTLRIKGLHIRSLNLVPPRLATRASHPFPLCFSHNIRKLYLCDCPELREIRWEDGRSFGIRKPETSLSLEAGDLTESYEIVSLEALHPTYSHTYPQVRLGALHLTNSHNIPHVRSIHIRGPLLDMDMDWVIHSCPEIEDLVISDNPHRLRRLPLTLTSLIISCCGSPEFMGDGTYPLLQRLSINDISYDPSRPFHFGSLMNLAYLEIKGCLGLASISASFVQNLPHLSVLSVSHCPELLAFSSEGLPAPNLATLSIDKCQKLMSLPANMCTSLASLQSLYINDCPEIDSFPDGGLPPCLHTLCIKNCPKLMSCRTAWPLQQVTCLRKLEIEGCDSTISFPEENFLPASLTHLKITAFRNLSSLVVSELHGLTSLRALEISLCWNLLSLPERMPLSLCYLEIMGCPDLAERCRRDEGRDWSKISHLLGINVDGMDI